MPGMLNLINPIGKSSSLGINSSGDEPEAVFSVRMSWNLRL